MILLKPSHFITIFLVIILLFDDVALPRRNASRHRNHRGQRIRRRGRRCRPVPQTIYLTFPNCRKKIIHTLGCAGRCRSETSMQVYGRAVVPKCSCCRPDTDKQMTFMVFITCTGDQRVLKEVRLLVSRSCSCSPCGNCVIQFFWKQYVLLSLWKHLGYNQYR